MKNFAYFIKALLMAVLGIYGSGGRLAAVWELWPILGLEIGLFLVDFLRNPTIE